MRIGLVIRHERELDLSCVKALRQAIRRRRHQKQPTHWDIVYVMPAMLDRGMLAGAEERYTIAKNVCGHVAHILALQAPRIFIVQGYVSAWVARYQREYQWQTTVGYPSIGRWITLMGKRGWLRLKSACFGVVKPLDLSQAEGLLLTAPQERLPR